MRLRILESCHQTPTSAADATSSASSAHETPGCVDGVARAGAGPQSDKLATRAGARDAVARWGTPTMRCEPPSAPRILSGIAKRSPRYQRTVFTVAMSVSVLSIAQTVSRFSPIGQASGGSDHRPRRRPRLDQGSPQPPRSPTSFPRSWAHPLGFKCSPTASAGSAREPAPGPLLRSATQTASHYGEPHRLLRRARPRRLGSFRPQRRFPAGFEAATTASRILHCSPQPSSPRQHGPRRPRLGPAQTLRGASMAQRGRDLRGPTPLQHHPGHASKPIGVVKQRIPNPCPKPPRKTGQQDRDSTGSVRTVRDGRPSYGSQKFGVALERGPYEPTSRTGLWLTLTRRRRDDFHALDGWDRNKRSNVCIAPSLAVFVDPRRLCIQLAERVEGPEVVGLGLGSGR